MPEGSQWDTISPEIQLALLKQATDALGVNQSILSDKVSVLERADAVKEEQLKGVFDNFKEFKESQDKIMQKLDDRDRQDKETLQLTIKQNREIKVLIIGAIATAIASALVPMLIK